MGEKVGSGRYRFLRWTIAAVALVWTAWMSLLPVASLPSISVWDKAAHFANYAVLTFLLASVLGRHRHGQAAVLVMLYGVLIEIAQAYGGQRMGDWQDAVANGAGILTAWCLLCLVARIRKERAD